MTAKYLLPCPCGEKIPIEVGQSGQTISCRCGRQLDAPTMLEIRRLEQVPTDAPVVPSRTWGIHQALALIGGLIVLVAVCLLGGLYVTRPLPPQAPDEQRVAKVIGELSLLDSMREWANLPRDLRDTPQYAVKAYNDRLAARYRWMGVVAVIGVAGILCAAASLLVSPARSGGDGKRG